MQKPLVLTMGDPAGIGIEIAAKAWLARTNDTIPPFALLAHLGIATEQLQTMDLNVPVREINNLTDVSVTFPTELPVLNLQTHGAEKQTIEAIDRAVSLCQLGDAAGMVTNPIQKKRLYDAGFKHPGHTEYLAALTGASGSEVMMFACDELKVVPATVHVPLDKVSEVLTDKLLETIIRTTAQDVARRFGVLKPRIVIAGLNPHAGEKGTMGTEEVDVISPVIAKLNGEGFNLTGPFPADSLFHKAARQTYDAAICMYHDQALIPIKTIDFDGGVNVTLGLPIVRTSPDHGTAEDIAGKGIASAGSLIAALKMAHEMATYSDKAPFK
jgi:4-hydroxythreonine-4-phosphate dehydrogenase